jgi:hypothetical protein
MRDGVAQAYVLLLPGLGAELELQDVAIQPDVFVVERGDPV